MTHPKLCSDLEIAEQKDGLIVKDPARNKFYRFTGPSALVLKSLGRGLALDEIHAELAQEAKVRIAPATVAQFVQRLGDMSLLEGTEPQVSTPPARTSDLLNLKLKAFDPRRLFDWLLPRTSFLFTWGFFCISLALLAAALFVSVTRGGEIGGSVLQLIAPSGLPEFLLLALLIGAVHELAHGLVCEHFGGRVREIGFLLMFFQPCLYCDVSASWMLPKRQRLLVMLAGNYSTFLIWAGATLAWRVLDPQTALSHLCVNIILITGLSLFANFNPLIKLDGYYILSDLLGMPNLRPRTLNYLKFRLESRPINVTPSPRTSSAAPPSTARPMASSRLTSTTGSANSSAAASCSARWPSPARKPA
jgi:putative peptide zinc metalloprotease protein